MDSYEVPTRFYLGREYDVASRTLSRTSLLYDSKDLTTHAVIVGMTGSGKTGLGITLLEEAAIDGIPAIIIDPKGDMGNLLLSFPQLTGSDFEPWVQQEEATRKGMTVGEFAASRAELWRNGLAEWEQSAARIQRFRDCCDVAIYTPGSDAGLPLTVLKSLDAPPPEVLGSSDAMRERVSAAASGLLSLLGIDADPIRSREHILISNILDNAWRAGKNLDLGGLIYEIQSPSFKKIGIMDVDQIFPQAERMGLAMTLNNVLASPSFSGWMQGEPLNIQRLLYTSQGKPRLCVLSISHLSDRERMFFVTILLNEVIAWMRTQPGTSSLRALLYMDEVFGYLPPTANPPTKTPMLTLLKQARAFGLGLVLSTQNPVDLDYKALSNAGTWFLGRLQTERDKLRVLDGLEGASASAGTEFDRARVEQILSAVGNRVFLLNNVHEDQPVTFQTRWALSYLSGPMTRQQIQRLMADRKRETVPPPVAGAIHSPPVTTAVAMSAAPTGPVLQKHSRPLLPDSIDQFFAPIDRSVPRDAVLTYRPALIGQGRVTFSDSKAGVNESRVVQRVLAVDERIPREPWREADNLDARPLDFDRQPTPEADWSELPSELTKSTNYTSWKKRLSDYLYQEERVKVYHCVELDCYSRPGQPEGDFRAELSHRARQACDLAIEKLKQKYAPKIAAEIEDIRNAEHRVAQEEEQASSASTSAWLATGTSILGALFGRKKVSVTNIGRAGSAAKAHSRASQQKAEIARAKEKLDKEIDEKEAVEQELKESLNEIARQFDSANLKLETVDVEPRRSDVDVSVVGLLWLPFQIDDRGHSTPAWPQP
ncbi:MAG: DUF87 domain-containing protein [Planctomycetaceae bacterium]